MEAPGAHTVADELARFTGQRIEAVDGNADQSLDRLEGRATDDVRTVKKRLFLGNELYVVVCFLMYGPYRVTEMSHKVYRHDTCAACGEGIEKADRKAPTA